MGVKEMESDFSQWWDKREQAQNEAQKIPFKCKKDPFYCKGSQTLVWAAKRGCGAPILGDTASL